MRKEKTESIINSLLFSLCVTFGLRLKLILALIYGHIAHGEVKAHATFLSLGL